MRDALTIMRDRRSHALASAPPSSVKVSSRKSSAGTVARVQGYVSRWAGWKWKGRWCDNDLSRPECEGACSADRGVRDGMRTTVPYCAAGRVATVNAVNGDGMSCVVRRKGCCNGNTVRTSDDCVYTARTRSEEICTLNSPMFAERSVGRTVA